MALKQETLDSGNLWTRRTFWKGVYWSAATCRLWAARERSKLPGFVTNHQSKRVRTVRILRVQVIVGELCNCPPAGLGTKVGALLQAVQIHFAVTEVCGKSTLTPNRLISHYGRVL